MFNFLKNNLKKPIDIDITTSSKYYLENIEDAIGQTKFPNWTKDIHVPSIREVFKYMFDHKVGYNTIKTCPAFVDILKNSFSVYSPCDIVIEIDKQTNIWRWVTRTKNISVTGFNLPMQMGSNNPFSGKGIHLKIELPFILKSSEPISLFFTQPMYHVISEFMVIPGAIEINKKTPIQLSLNIFVPNQYIHSGTQTENTKIIHIKTGDVLSYLYYGKNIKVGNVNTSYVTPEQFPNTIEHLNLLSNWVKTNKE